MIRLIKMYAREHPENIDCQHSLIDILFMHTYLGPRSEYIVYLYDALYSYHNNGCLDFPYIRGCLDSIKDSVYNHEGYPQYPIFSNIFLEPRSSATFLQILLEYSLDILPIYPLQSFVDFLFLGYGVNDDMEALSRLLLVMDTHLHFIGIDFVNACIPVFLHREDDSITYTTKCSVSPLILALLTRSIDQFPKLIDIGSYLDFFMATISHMTSIDEFYPYLEVIMRYYRFATNRRLTRSLEVIRNHGIHELITDLADSSEETEEKTIILLEQYNEEILCSK